MGSQSLVPALAVRGAYWWPSGGLSWSDGDEVDVSLSVAADAVPVGVRDAAPLWAYFDRVPDTHDGTDALEVRLRFGEDVDVDAAALRDSVIVAAGGTVTAVEAAADSTRDWTVTVQPDGAGDVVVSVGSGLSCADPAAVCTADGRTLAADISVGVAGPAASVSLDALTLDGATALAVGESAAGEITVADTESHRRLHSLHRCLSSVFADGGSAAARLRQLRSAGSLADNARQPTDVQAGLLLGHAQGVAACAAMKSDAAVRACYRDVVTPHSIVAV